MVSAGIIRLLLARTTHNFFYTNQISSDGYTISYLEKSGNIRLEYILLKKFANNRT